MASGVQFTNDAYGFSLSELIRENRRKYLETICHDFPIEGEFETEAITTNGLDGWKVSHYDKETDVLYLEWLYST